MPKNFLVGAFDCCGSENREGAGSFRAGVSLKTLGKKRSGLCGEEMELGGK
jgi:hypothetical protein